MRERECLFNEVRVQFHVPNLSLATFSASTIICLSVFTLIIDFINTHDA